MKSNSPKQHLEGVLSSLEDKKRYEGEELKADFQSLRESMDVSNLLKQGLRSGIENSSMKSDFKSSALTLVLATVLKAFSGNKPKTLPTTIIGYVIKTGLVGLILTKVVSIFRKKS